MRVVDFEDEPSVGGLRPQLDPQDLLRCTHVPEVSGTAGEVGQAGGSYALASQAQSWWTASATGPPPVDLPATVLWGEADRSHLKASTDPEQVLDLLPQGRLARVPAAGHFVDTEDVATTARHLRLLFQM